MSQRRVLVVDDDADMSLMLARHLESEGMVVGVRAIVLSLGKDGGRSIQLVYPRAAKGSMQRG